MTTRPISSKVLACQIFATGLLLSGFAVQSASAGLTWDLRATTKNGVALSAAEAKAVNVVTGDVIEIGMFAVIVGAAGNAALEGFQSGLGKTITTHTLGFGGNQGAPVMEPLFVNTGGTVPTIADLNGDGFLDLGVTNTTTSSTTGGWFPRTSLAPGFQTNGVPITDGQEFKLFHFNYTVVAAVSGTASIQFTQQLTTVINSGAYSLDGSALVASKALGQPAGATGTFLGSPVVLSVPEPSAFGMVLVGALSMVGFRRFGLRRQS